MTVIAAAFEEIVADAPEQWWAVFFPIWPDLEGATLGGPGDAARAPGAASAGLPSPADPAVPAGPA
jgi:hypothetical protein